MRADEFRPDELTRDHLLGGRIALSQPRGGYRAATDPVLLAAAVDARPGQHALELGCGAGAALLCLGARVPGLQLAGLELQPAYLALARANADANGIAAELFEGDVAAPPTALRARVFDHVLMNPPFFDPAGSASPDPGRARAHREETPLAAWIDTGLRRLRPGGWLTVIQRTERLPDILAPLAARAGSIDVLPLAARAGRAPKRILLRARKDAKGPFRLLPPLVLHAGATHHRDGDDFSEAARAVLSGASPLPWGDGR